MNKVHKETKDKVIPLVTDVTVSYNKAIKVVATSVISEMIKTTSDDYDRMFKFRNIIELPILHLASTANVPEHLRDKYLTLQGLDAHGNYLATEHYIGGTVLSAPIIYKVARQVASVTKYIAVMNSDRSHYNAEGSISWDLVDRALFLNEESAREYFKNLGVDIPDNTDTFYVQTSDDTGVPAKLPIILPI